MTQDVAEFWNLAGRHRACMLTTSDGGQLRSRPMAPLLDKESGEVRFLTRASSHKAEEISNDARVNLVFVEDGDMGYVSVVGTAKLTQDRELIRSLWSPSAQGWLPEGPDGPDVALIRVRALRAEIWDLKSLSMTSFWDMATAVPGGKLRDLGGHHEVRL